jgi:DGQHR domain-containing protein
MKSYSANDEFRNLCQNLGFDFVLFDDPIYDKISVKDKDKGADIDAIIYENNVVCAVAINEGSSNTVDSKLRNFFHKLDRRDKFSSLELEIDPSHKSNSEYKKVGKELQKLSLHFKKYSKKYKQIFIKIFFCPNKVIADNEFELRRNPNEIIIDQDVYQYLVEVGKRLTKQCVVNDFYYLLGINKGDLKKIVSGKSIKPLQSHSYLTEKVEIDKHLTIFTLCPTVEDVQDYVTVRRISNKYDKEGFQRMVKATRLKKINAEYLSKHSTFPNNIIMALNPAVYKKEKDFFEDDHFNFYEEFNSLFLIDGQHRFYSFVTGKKTARQIVLTLLFFKHPTDAAKYIEMDNFFYEINKKAEKIDPNLAFALVAKMKNRSDENFWYTVFVNLLKRSTLFGDRFTFKETTIKEFNKKSIISVLQYGGILKLNNGTKKKGVLIPGLTAMYPSTKRLEQIEFATTLIQNYFSVIEEVLNNQGFDKSHLSPRDIGAFLRLLYHFMISEEDSLKLFGTTKNILKSKIKKEENASNVFRTLVASVNFKTLFKLDLSPSNWAAVEGYLLKNIQKNGDSSFGNKDILSKKGLEMYKL